MAYNYMSMEQPVRPDFFNPLYNPDGTAKAGTAMSPDVQAMMDKINPNTQGLDKFRQEALRTGPSAWASLATQQQQGEESNARDRAGSEAAGQTAQAKASLAQSGGLTSGAAERVAAGGARNYLDMSQQIGQAGNNNRLQIGMNDEQNRMTELGQLPGMENQALQPAFQKAQLIGQAKQFDVGNQTANASSQNAFNMGNYTEQMNAWGANKQADATQNAGKHGFLGLGK